MRALPTRVMCRAARAVSIEATLPCGDDDDEEKEPHVGVERGRTTEPERDEWWRDAVCYELYPRSFADGDGDGIGDLRGAAARLDHVAALGADAVWITPFYPSPLADGGYDISDHTAVAPELGTLDDWHALVTRARALGLRVLVDLVPNHTSRAHPWFSQLLAAPEDDRVRGRYIVRPGRGPGGAAPPNDWRSAFGGPAWSRLPEHPGHWYLHLHTPDQPDLDWRNPEVVAEYDRVIRFWLDHGADGFRVDVAHTLFKAPGLPDAGPDQHRAPARYHLRPYYDREEVHSLFRTWRRLLASRPGPAGERVLVGEAVLFDQQRLARYVRTDELHQVFNFPYAECPWDGAALRRVIEESYAAMASAGAPVTWLLSSHDAVRPVTRFGGGTEGLRRARAAALLTLALPGAAYVYQGEELGLPQAWVPEERRRDPLWELSGHTDPGRDGCRVPLPWAGDEAPYGFTDAPPGKSWLPQPPDWTALTVRSQEADPASTLVLYRAALRLRRQYPDEGAGPCRLEGPASGEWLGFRRGRDLRCVVNFGPGGLRLDPDAEIVLSSVPVTDGVVPPDTTVWLRSAAT
ncbi:alpha-amylase family glycosyl hydrolase [Streptomyces sp. BR1]|uniref:alpha-amylase family glycosyl hydrolase n=1 Tax=Streptomyces sp. BR1 TaxID=1592323 RepID=UPI00402B6075